MTRYTRAHKEQTHRQILEAAARAFRAEGILEVSIPKLMAEVGLTHGGFYAHFASKDALVAQACARGLAETVDTLLGVAAAEPPERQLRAVIARYLSTDHRDHAAEGCVLPALTEAIARGTPAVRHAFTAAVKEYVARLAPLLPDASAEARAERELVLAAGMAGAMALARAVDDPDLSLRILQACRAFYTRAFTDPLVPAGVTEGAGE